MEYAEDHLCRCKQLKPRIEVYQEKRPHWEGAGAAKGYPAEHKFLVMNARRHQSDTRTLILVTKSMTVNI